MQADLFGGQADLFEELNLSADLLKGLYVEMKFERPSKIQTISLPMILTHDEKWDRYAGEYFGDKIHGFGVYHFADGHCYEGHGTALLAVKKLDTTACRKQSNEDFLELVFSVSKLKHADVVELVGYCAEHGQQLLVFLGGDFGAGFLSPTLSA
ncbi:DEAD-box ATP-dependent RNA helicase 38 [Camellia lanceoleosa]|uniref:DEAD-box ATP-dependent RNA helicase 38 n=1 Tax=Camellia lanceoleosa TaxID=1840588 RepID=A0ACC0GBK4_9ERIC|nr:DEAD-box ATP-dependent RNA helicase 38 [Camellia lanceoleosa]